MLISAAAGSLAAGGLVAVAHEVDGATAAVGRGVLVSVAAGDEASVERVRDAVDEGHTGRRGDVESRRSAVRRRSEGREAVALAGGGVAPRADLGRDLLAVLVVDRAVESAAVVVDAE